MSYFPGVIIRSFLNWVAERFYSAVEQHTIHQTISGGNIVHQIDTLLTFGNGQFANMQAFETTVSYLPNPNPFFKIFNATAKNYFTGIGIGNFTNSQYAPEHLIAKQISTIGNVAYDYVFRVDGYPLTARKTTSEVNGSKTVTKLLFVYAQN